MQQRQNVMTRRLRAVFGLSVVATAVDLAMVFQRNGARRTGNPLEAATAHASGERGEIGADQLELSLRKGKALPVPMPVAPMAFSVLPLSMRSPNLAPSNIGLP